MNAFGAEDIGPDRLFTTRFYSGCRWPRHTVVPGGGVHEKPAAIFQYLFDFRFFLFPPVRILSPVLRVYKHVTSPFRMVLDVLH